MTTMLRAKFGLNDVLGLNGEKTATTTVTTLWMPA